MILLIAAVAGTLKGLSTQRWVFRPDDGVVQWFSRTATGRQLEEELDLEQVVEIVTEAPTGWFRQAVVRMVLRDESIVVIARGTAKEMDIVGGRVQRILSAYAERRRLAGVGGDELQSG